MNRKPFLWRVLGIWAALLVIRAFIPVPFVLPKNITDLAAFSIIYHDKVLLNFVFGALGIPLFLGLNVQRFHDRNMSGWWNVPFLGLGFNQFFLEYIGLATKFVVDQSGNYLVEATRFSEIVSFVILLPHLWLFIELFFRKGTVGPNRFGPDPLAEK